MSPVIASPPSRTIGARAGVYALGLVSVVTAFTGVALLRNAQPRAAGQGFAVQSWQGQAGCELGQSSVQTRADEPYLTLSPRGPGCERWTSFMAVDRRRRSVFELESEGARKLWIDGRLIIDQHPRRASFTTRGSAELDPGVHRVEVQHIHKAGAAYLRLREHDLNEPHFEYSLPPLDTGRFFLDASAASSALRRGLALPHPSRALLAFGAWALAGVCGWLAFRLGTRRGRARPQPLWDLAIASALSVAAFVVRIAGIPSQDLAWDELAYVIAGRHMLRNLQLGDYAHDAFRWNYYHPPIAKWIYGLAWELGGHDGARLVSALLSAISVGFLYGIAKLLYARRIAIGAGAIAVFLPGLVAHSRLTGLESVLVFFWMASLLAAVAWAHEIERSRSNPGGADSRASCAFFAGAAAILAIGARMTAIWLLPLLAFIFVVGARHLSVRRRFAAAFALVLGGALALAVVAALWPWLSLHPVTGWQQIIDRWGSQHTVEVFLGQDLRPPPLQYYLAAFVATTPALLLVMGLLGAIIGLRRRELRMPTLITVLWLTLPFLQSFSVFRQDLARYVIQSWPALALLAALSTELSIGLLARRFGSSESPAGRRNRALIGVGLCCVLPVYTAITLLRIEPYPLDYFSELVGGPLGIARSHSFELAWWGEGFRDAVDYLNRQAPAGARVRVALTPGDTCPRLRDDLQRVGPRPADYVVTNNYKFKPERAPGCDLVHRVQVRGAPLVDVYRCDRSAGRIDRGLASPHVITTDGQPP